MATILHSLNPPNIGIARPAFITPAWHVAIPKGAAIRNHPICSPKRSAFRLLSELISKWCAAAIAKFLANIRGRC